MDRKLRERVLKRIKPKKSEDNLFWRGVKSFLEKLENAKNKLFLDCDFFVGGSFGKGTYLRGDFDVDVFCRFSKNYEDDKLSSLLEIILKEAKVSYKKQKGSRDYFSSFFKIRGMEIVFEIVPNKRISKISEAVNSTDFSPMHVLFIKKKALRNKRLTDEIRLAKQFFKAKGLYGAESFVGGFSGHVIDILISYYGSLMNLLEGAKKWGKSFFVDVSGHYKSERQALKKIALDKQSNLIVVDPILCERNAARALSVENYFKFVCLAKTFSDFEADDFMVKKESANELVSEFRTFAKRNNFNFLGYYFKLKFEGETKDILGSKMLKLCKKVMAHFASYDFTVFKYRFFIDLNKRECVFLFLFNELELPKFKVVCGPEVFRTDAVLGFLKGRKDYFISGDKVCLEVLRKVTKISKISSFKLKDFARMLNKDISFVSSVKKLE